jgi:hypothetical protein
MVIGAIVVWALYVDSSLSYLMAIFKLSELNENCARKKFK